MGRTARGDPGSGLGGPAGKPLCFSHPEISPIAAKHGQGALWQKRGEGRKFPFAGKSVNLGGGRNSENPKIPKDQSFKMSRKIKFSFSEQ